MDAKPILRKQSSNSKRSAPPEPLNKPFKTGNSFNGTGKKLQSHSRFHRPPHPIHRKRPKSNPCTNRRIQKIRRRTGTFCLTKNHKRPQRVRKPAQKPLPSYRKRLHQCQKNPPGSTKIRHPKLDIKSALSQKTSLTHTSTTFRPSFTPARLFLISIIFSFARADLRFFCFRSLKILFAFSDSSPKIRSSIFKISNL